MRRITVPLKTDERDALWQLAERERRDPRDQAAVIVVKELERAGLLSTAGVKADAPTEPGKAAQS
jgi:hypothetical protein